LEEIITASAHRSWVRWALIGAVAGVAVVVAALAIYLTTLTVSFTLDGTPQRLSAGARVSDLFARGLVKRRSGNLVSAASGHRVLRAGDGGQPFVESGSEVLTPTAVISSNARLTSHDGTDVVEPTRITTETIAFSVQYVGDGPVESVIESGSPGVREIKVGVISNQLVSKRKIVSPVDRIIRRSPVYAGTKVVALTFDDGPWPGSTEAILNVLKKYGVVATFFEIGRQARQMPSLSHDVAAAGMELGNHSETHPLNLGKLSAQAVSNEITYAEHDIQKASGQAPAYFRPPGGNTTAAMYPVLSKLGMRWIQWDVDTDDWKRPSASRIKDRVLENVRPGAVVLMHDGGGDRSHTVQALPGIIQGLRAMGYSFVKVSALRTVPHRMG
jgi:peptidoglycan/xylan/chitin deacetylase (PgdA/CDA1 family)